MASVVTVEELQRQVEELRAHHEAMALRVRTLEDIEAIRALHARYHDYVDVGPGGKAVDGAGLREVFTEDVFFYWGAERDPLTDEQGREATTGHHGLENVVAMLESSTSVWELAVHSMLNEEIEVNGDTAMGTRTDWVATRSAASPNLWFLKGSSSYVRTLLGWRIRSIELHYAGRLMKETPAAGQE